MPHPFTIAPDVLSSYVGGEAILLHLRDQTYCRLNPTAASVWRGIEQGLTRPDIVAELCRAYDVDAAQADAATAQVVDDLVRRRLLLPGRDD